MTGLGSKLAENCGVPSSNVDLSIANAKAVIVTFTIYIPESLASSGVNLASVQAAMSNTTSLLAAINSVLTSLGLPTVSSVEPFIAASSTPSASPSPSSHTEDKASDSSDLSDGAIAGIVIGSVVGAILLVGLGVFLQMRHHNKTKREHAIVATAKAEDPSRPLKGKDDPINQRL
jgi:cell wall integrity and stress response component